MKLDNTFEVALPIEQAWSLLVDLPRLAPCLPGARLEDVVDGEYRGGLSTTIGPINARYQGSARFLERDEVARRAVIQATGREISGTGTASVTITATLRPAGTATGVELSTEMAISGRGAQFGRTLLAEVGATLIGEFARRVEAEITHPTESRRIPSAADLLGDARFRRGCRRIGNERHSNGTGPAPKARDDLDVTRTVAIPVLRRAAVPAVAALLGAALAYLLGRRHPGR